ncbi:NAD(P)/FAD-dependent oxidoreductase [Vandammella animalimorsus]|uniref:Ferredoxin--NADP reductase n=1 Tax=Vandammella animalimorsus TaxID=2029117 RepID=A0A2A2AAR5_9BURK|nr:NAD(P)/FAD-dependent oxidoreductase [Vandammella animalimorsus]PAT35630.1 ferredoxin--NADP(+) reductase [Vandammella animalimorsus]
MERPERQAAIPGALRPAAPPAAPAAPGDGEGGPVCDAVVVGAGPAGLYQLFQLGLQGLRCHAFEALPQPGGQCAQLYPHKPIYDIPALQQVSGAQLSERLWQQLSPFAIDWHWGQTVTAIEPDAHPLPGNGAPLWRVRTDAGEQIRTRAVVLALGVGAFVPRSLRLEGLEALLAQGQQVFLQTRDGSATVAGRHVVLHGGGEDAVRKALQLAALPAAQAPSRLTLLHRRDVFTAEADELQQLRALQAQGCIHIATGQLQALTLADAPGAAPRLQALQLLNAQGQREELALDVLLLYQGIAPKLGAALEWDVGWDAKHIRVDPATMRSCRAGIYAIGDIASYPGKRKLIACSFHEATLAAFAIAEQHHQQALPTPYTTTSKQLLARLGRLDAA